MKNIIKKKLVSKFLGAMLTLGGFAAVNGTLNQNSTFAVDNFDREVDKFDGEYVSKDGNVVKFKNVDKVNEKGERVTRIYEDGAYYVGQFKKGKIITKKNTNKKKKKALWKSHKIFLDQILVILKLMKLLKKKKQNQ